MHLAGNVKPNHSLSKI